MPTLIVTCDAIRLHRRLVIRAERFTIGRSPTADVSIPDGSLSEVHLVIARGPSGHTFEDLWSASGTYRNGAQQSSGVLRDGDVLRLGRAEILFRTGEAEEGAEEAAAPMPREGKEFAVPKLDWRRTAGGDLRASSIHRRIEGENRILRIVMAHKAATVTIVIGGLCIVAALLLGNMGGLYRAVEKGTLEREEPIAARPPAATSGPREADVGAAKVETPRRDGDDPAEEIREDLSKGPDRPYLDAGESERVLFRLFLDLLGRPPTRPEVASLEMLRPAARWDAVAKLAEEAGKRAPRQGTPGSPRNEAAAAYRRFLGRSPTRDEERAATLPGPSGTPAGAPGPRTDLGLLLTASDRYRSAEFRRKRGPGQMAASFIVDFLDRPPMADEVRDIEVTLDEVSTAAAIGRILAYSTDGEGALPSFPTQAGAGGPGEKAGGGPGPASGGAGPEGLAVWVRAEARRFLLREPTKEEIDEVLAAAAGARGSKDAARWVRVALAGLEEYGSY